MEFLKEFLEFLKVRKKYWLIPIFIVLVLYMHLNTCNYNSHKHIQNNKNNKEEGFENTNITEINKITQRIKEEIDTTNKISENLQILKSDNNIGKCIKITRNPSGKKYTSNDKISREKCESKNNRNTRKEGIKYKYLEPLIDINKLQEVNKEITNSAKNMNMFRYLLKKI